MKHRWTSVALLALGWTIVILVMGYGLRLDPVYAEGLAMTYYVDDDTCPSTGSGTSADPFCRIQDAIDAATDGDEIRIAQGTYTGTETVLDVTTGYTYTQVALITRTLTLRGGYDPGDWNVWDPAANPTVVDAERAGRAISIVGSGTETVTVEGLTLTGGDYTGLGNPANVPNQVCAGRSADCGGGLFAFQAALILEHTVITDNIASRGGAYYGQGGGIYLWDTLPGTRIAHTTVVSNSAVGIYAKGGGIMVQDGDGLSIEETVVAENEARQGGGLFFLTPRGPVVIEATDVLDNWSYDLYENGAGLYVRLSSGAEIFRMDRVRVAGNSGRADAVGLYIKGAEGVEMVLSNVLFAENEGRDSDPTDSVVFIDGEFGADVAAAHVTTADNLVPAFLRAEASYLGRPVTITLTNTLVASTTYGFVGEHSPGDGDLQIRHTNTLTWNVTTLHYAGTGTPDFQAVNPLTGDPLLDADHRLTSGSAALDAGIDTGLDYDFEGDFRPQETAPDIGWDERYRAVAADSVALSCPSTVAAGAPAHLVATIDPWYTSYPITYTWRPEGFPEVVHVLGSPSDAIDVVWTSPDSTGAGMIARNPEGVVSTKCYIDVLAIPALAIEKTAPAAANVGTPITYTLTVTNNGLVDATGVTITDTLPVGAHYVRGGTLVGDVISWTVPAITANGGTFEGTFVVTATETITNHDYGAVASGGYRAAAVVPVVTVATTPDLHIEKTGPFAADVGEEITYEIVVTNDGTGDVTDVLITDTLPADAHYVTGGTLVGNEVRWTTDTLAADGGTFVAQLVVTATETITNAAYGVTSLDGYDAQGTVSVVTIVGRGTRYAAPGGVDGLNPCTDSGAPCATIQHAVDVANNDEEVRVVTGVYTGTHARIDWHGYVYTQVVYIDHNVVLRGGYDPVDWTTPDPIANPTVIDAEGTGRGIAVAGFAWRVTIEGFTVTGGDASGMGNPEGEGNQICAATSADCGGGVYAHSVTLILRDMTVIDNVASRPGSGRSGYGGGVYISWPRFGTRIESSSVVSNTVAGSNGSGGGIYTTEGYDVTISGSTITRNRAFARGGGVAIHIPRRPAVIEATDFLSNTQESPNREGGGGLYLHLSYAGEGLHLDRVRMAGNAAAGPGAALGLNKVGVDWTGFELSNVLLTGNEATGGGETDAVIAVSNHYNSAVDLVHVTAADNRAPAFLRAEAPESGHAVDVVLTNTLVTSATYGFVGYQDVGDGDLLIRHTRTFTHNVATLHHIEDGVPVLEAIETLGGDPMLDAEHHLLEGSPAVDAGLDAGMAFDIDGDRRIGAPDIGADEFPPYIIHLPLVLR